MRLLKNLNEYVSVEFKTDIDKMMSLIERDCKRYLKQLKGETPLYRAANLSGIMGNAAVRQDRIPSGLHIYGERGYDFLNNWLQKKRMARRDKSIQCTSEKSHAKLFLKGRHTKDFYYIFPADPFKWAYCNHRDFNFDPFIHDYLKFINPEEREKTSNEAIRNISQKEAEKRASEYLKEFIFKKDFEGAYSMGYEMWYECKNYYYISASEFDL